MIDNTGETIVTDGAGNQWGLAGGELAGGIMQAVNGGTLDVFDGKTSRLRNIEVHAPVQIHDGSVLQILDDVTLVNANASISGVGVIEFAPNGTMPTLRVPNGSLVFGPGIEVRDSSAAGAIVAGTGAVRNEGLMRVSNASGGLEINANGFENVESAKISFPYPGDK